MSIRGVGPSESNLPTPPFTNGATAFGYTMLSRLSDILASILSSQK